MYTHHEYLLVVRAVEDANLAAPWETLRVAPEEIVIELLSRGHLEAVHSDALRVHPAHHVADRSHPFQRCPTPATTPTPPTCPEQPTVPGTQRAVVLPRRARATPSLFFFTPPLRAASKSSARITSDPGFTRNGSMNSATRL